MGGCVRERERGGYVYYMGFSGGSDGKESTCNVGGLGSIPGLGRSLEEAMATHSSILAWRVPSEQRTRLESIGSQRAGLD